MILIDTSIWIEIFKKNPKVTIPKEMAANIGVCFPVIQEILQGIRDEKSFHRIKNSLLSFKLFGDPLKSDDFIHAAEIYRSGQRRGITIRSSIDCLIATIAIQANIPLWQKDRDFEKIAKYTELRLY